MLVCGVLGKDAILDLIGYITTISGEGKVNTDELIKSLVSTIDNDEQKINIAQVIPAVIQQTYPFLNNEEQDNLLADINLNDLRKTVRNYQDREFVRADLLDSGLIASVEPLLESELEADEQSRMDTLEDEILFEKFKEKKAKESNLENYLNNNDFTQEYANRIKQLYNNKQIEIIC